ncbi:MAG TPA: Ig-like domain-containing protein [Puia sp.]|jgi:adhesin/invasin|nr:Ig-like domain-containing protein [Puia sp.]
MTLKIIDNDVSAVARIKARFSFIGMLLLSCVVLPGFFQTTMAAPGNPGPGTGGYTYTVTVVKDFSIFATGTDIISVALSPTPPYPPGESITFNVGGGSSSYVVQTDASGVATLYFTNNAPATLPVVITDGAIPIQTVSMTFIAAPGPPDPARSYFTVVQNPENADGSSQDLVEAFIYDTHGNAIPGATVNWTIQSGTATFATSSSPTTGSDGSATTGLTSMVVGNVNLTAQAAYAGNVITLHDQGSPPNNFLAIQFIQPPPVSTLSYIVATVTPMPADGTSKDQVQAVVNNAVGPVPDGTVVTFTIQSGTATMTTTGTTVGGVATAYFTSTVVGSVQVQATINGGTFLNDQANPANNFVTVQFVIPPPDATKSYVVATVTPMAADGTSQDQVQAVVNNALGPVPDGTPVVFTIQTGTATITTTGTTVGGVATAYFTSTVVGAVQVQAQINGTTFLNDQANPPNNFVTVQFTQPPPVATLSYVVATVTPQLADGSSQDQVQAVVNNALGPVPDGTVVTFTIMSGTATMTTTGTTVGGVATASFTSTVVGPVQVQAQINGTTYLNDQNNPANNYVTIQFIVGQAIPGQPGGGGAGGSTPGGGGLPPGSGGSGTGGSGSSGNTNPGSNSGYTVLFVTQDFQLADGTHQDSVYAYITDASKHPVPGASITFAIQNTPTSGTATAAAQLVGQAATTTNANGIAGIGVVSTKPGTVYINAILTVGGVSVLIDGSYQVVTFLNMPDINNPLTALSVVIYEALADGSQQTEVKAHIVDLDGNVMPGQEVIFKIDSGNGVIVTPQPAVTDANGDAYIYITSKTPGYVNITATVGGQSIIYGSPARVKFAPINIYVPKVFTPNNDGTNDLLKPILVGIQTFHYFSVYNRWGNLIFTTQDPNQGWDGTFKGVAQPVETYLWIAEGIDVTGKKIVAKGMTSLVR